MKHSNPTNAFGGTFAFLPTHKAKQKNAKEPPSHRTINRKDSANLTQQTFMDREARTANKVLPQWGLTEVIEHLCYYQHLCIFSADGFQNPPLRQYPNVTSNPKRRQC